MREKGDKQGEDELKRGYKRDEEKIREGEKMGRGDKKRRGGDEKKI